MLFSILLVFGYSKILGKTAFWNNSNDLKNYAVYRAMHRNRFDHRMRCLHFIDNNKLDDTDKYSKIRPIVY